MRYVLFEDKQQIEMTTVCHFNSSPELRNPEDSFHRDIRNTTIAQSMVGYTYVSKFDKSTAVCVNSGSTWDDSDCVLVIEPNSNTTIWKIIGEVLDDFGALATDLWKVRKVGLIISELNLFAQHVNAELTQKMLSFKMAFSTAAPKFTKLKDINHVENPYDVAIDAYNTWKHLANMFYGMGDPRIQTEVKTTYERKVPTKEGGYSDDRYKTSPIELISGKPMNTLKSVDLNKEDEFSKTPIKFDGDHQPEES